MATRFRSRGTLEVGGEVAVEDALDCQGTTHFLGAVRTGDLIARGSCRSSGDVTASRTARWIGSLEIAGSFLAGDVQFTGGFSIDGELRARSIEGILLQPSRGSSLRADKIVLRLGRSPFAPKGSLLAERIEAVEVELEGVDCEHIQAKRVALGRNCHITRVDAQIVRQHRSSFIGPESRSAPPHGLSR